MQNHVHLLLKMGREPLGQLMRRICGSYVYWYNCNYQRVGKLFQDRFRSEQVEDDTYFLIKQMLKAGIMNEVEVNLEGTQQGRVISPLLANIVLNKLDTAWHRPGGAREKYNARLVRYADDGAPRRRWAS